MVYVFDGQIFWRFKKKQPTWLESELSSDFLLVHGTTESPVHLRHITNKLKITYSFFKASPVQNNPFKKLQVQSTARYFSLQ